jgi:hypothetical protein
MLPSFVKLRNIATGEITERWPVDAAEIMQYSPDIYEVVDRAHFNVDLPHIQKPKAPAPTEPVAEPVVAAKEEIKQEPAPAKRPGRPAKGK